MNMPGSLRTDGLEEWRLLDLSHEDPYLNMAVEEAILRSVGAGESKPTLRLWQNENAVVIGYFQDAAKEANLSACCRLGTSVVRRVSGGGAVFHDRGNLNYALSIPRRDPRVPANILASYRVLCQGVIEALADLGLQAKYVPINDIIVDGYKVSGTAQARRWGGLLHHGTLLLNTDIGAMGRVLRVRQEYLQAKGASRLTEWVATTAQLGAPRDVSSAKDALSDGFSRVLGVQFGAAGLTEAETATAEQLWDKQYSRPEWNLPCPRKGRKFGHKPWGSDGVAPFAEAPRQ